MARPRFNRLSEWLAWQEQLHPSRIDLGLERVARVAGRMRLLLLPCPAIVVAGTNGKGSSVAMLDSIYRAAAYRTVCYTSPHLLKYNERVRVNGMEAGDDQLCAAFETVDEARDGISLSYFEFGTLAALDIVRQEAPDLAILEVGLGGRLDAVNIVDADVALVTSIGIDHVDWLGADRESIAREKAGIFRPGRPAICADPAPPHALQLAATAIGADWCAAGTCFHTTRSATQWSFHGCLQEWAALPMPALAGQHQLDNAAGALAVAERMNSRLPLDIQAIRQGLSSVQLSGRLQRLPGIPEILVDVAHNTAGAEALAGMLRSRRASGRTWVVLGMLSDKDAAGFGAAIADCVDEWCLASLPGERGMSAYTLQQRLGIPDRRAQRFGTVRAAFRYAESHAAANDRVVVCGSFSTVAEVLASRV